jgi:hypothetical protein
MIKNRAKTIREKCGPWVSLQAGREVRAKAQGRFSRWPFLVTFLATQKSNKNTASAKPTHH